MNVTPDFCSRAIAYLKVEERENNSGAEIALSHVDSPVIRSIGHGLLVSYLVDEGNSYSYVQNRHIEAAGVTEEELHMQAVKNLRALAEQNVEVRQYGSIFAVLIGGDFEASLALVDDFWSDWYAHLAPNGFTVAFPARDILAFCDSSSEEAVEELRALVERTQGQVDHPLSAILHRRVGGVWEPILG